MPMINVSDDTFRQLQELAIPFQDKEPDDVIRRLLGREKGSPAPAGSPRSGRDLASHVGRIPHGSKLRARYKGIDFVAEVADGAVVWDGRRYDSI